MKPLLQILLIALLCGCGRGAPPKKKSAPTKTPKRPNLLLITMDTTRADHLSCYGYKNIHTPNIDQLAKEGTLFEEAFAVQPVTLPAHSAIHTGLYPFHHGVRDNNTYKLPAKQQTIAETLQAAGYLNVAFVSSFILHHRFGLDQGFTYYNDRFIHPKQRGRLPVDRRAEETSFLAVSWFDEVKTELATHPFFMWVHYYDPHADYDPPPPYKEAYANPYDGEIAYMDDWMGYLFDQLKKRNLYDNTMIVMVADHGEGLGEHKENTHGMFIYRGTTHVPLIIKPARSRNGGYRAAGRVSQVDIAPTVYHQLGVQGKTGVYPLDGRDLSLALNGAPLGDKLAYSEVFIPRSFGWSELTGIRDGDYFFINAPKPELYKLSDKEERNNLFETQPKSAKKWQTRLAQLTREQEQSATDVPLSSEDIARLSALGYVATEQYRSKTSSETLPDPKDRIDLFNAEQKANQLVQKERLDDALTAYQRLVADDPNNPRFLMDLADLATRTGQFEIAEKALQNLLPLMPQSSKPHTMMGVLRKQQGQPHNAQIAFEQAIAIDPRDFIARFHLGAIFAAEENFKDARVQLEAALAIRREPALLNNLGYVHIHGFGHLKKGLAYIKQAVKIADDKVPFLISLGLAYREHQMINKARATFERAARLAPENPKVKELLGNNVPKSIKKRL